MKKIVLILFAVLCGAVAAVAQKAVVESFEAAPMDVTAQKYARLDKHGEKCALVKVSVVAPNVTFQGNVMGDVQKRGSEYWVYLTSGALTPKPTDPYADDIALTDEYVLFKDYYSTGKYGYKHKGRVVIPAKYDDAWPFSEGLALVEINGKYGFIDKTDTIVIPAKYDDAGSFSEGLARVEINGKYGFIDKTDTMVIPAKYDYATDFIEGLARVVIDGKYGFIDKTGTVVIPAKYDYAWPFSSGKAQVWLNGRQFFIDRNGNEVQ